MGIVERKIREKERRIQQILYASKFLFKTKGYINTTMLDIAEESELSRRTIYIYFKSKEEISYQVMREAHEALRTAIASSIEGHQGTGLEKILAIRDAYIDFYRNHLDQLLFILYYDFRANERSIDHDESQNYFAMIQSLIDLLVTALEEGCRDGSIRPLPDVRKTALTAITMIQSSMQKIAIRKDWIREQHSMDDSEVVDEMFALLISAIRAFPDDRVPAETGKG